MVVHLQHNAGVSYELHDHALFAGITHLILLPYVYVCM
jgi:hypothetical protein